MEISVVGVVWYRRQDYQRVLEVMEDAHLLPPTYDKWLHRAEKAIEECRRSGRLAVKANLDPEQFVIWCRERGMHVDADARNDFANRVAAAHHQHGHG